MSCTSPLIRIPSADINVKTGKNRGYLMNWNSYLESRGNHYRSFYDWKEHYMESHPEQIAIGEPKLIPCGHCAACRLQKSRDWANRCMLELKDHESAYFVTLTYNDDHLVDKNGEHWTPDMPRQPSVYKEHVRQFMRKLRDSTGQKLRYFACGEYGDKEKRPHYHIIIFGLIVPDLKFYKRSDLGDLYYTSEWLNKHWCQDMKKYPQPFGYTVLADVTWETCAYTARYCMKKRDGTEIWKLYEAMDVNPEFVTMSNHPGIAAGYYNRHGPDLLTSDGINISTKLGGKKVSVPQYYKRLASVDYSDFVDMLSDMVAHDVEIKEALKLKQVSYDQDEYFRHQKDIIETKVKQLRRKEF